MEIHFPPDIEEKLTKSAAKQGRNPDDLLQDVLAQYFKEEARPGEATHEFAGQILPELPVWNLGEVGSLHRRDIYDDAH